MALTHLLDTSVFCQPIKPRPLPSVIQRWQALGDDALAVSVLCQAEILYGIALKGSARLQAAYEAVLKDRLTVFPVDEAESQTYADMRAALEKAGKRVPDLDLLIAATAQTRVRHSFQPVRVDRGLADLAQSGFRHSVASSSA